MKKISIIANSYNYAFLFKEKPIEVDCDIIIPLGVRVVSAFNEMEETERRVQFLFQYGQNIIGSEHFKSFEEWNEYKSINCACCGNVECGVTVNGCFLTLNGCNLN